MLTSAIIAAHHVPRNAETPQISGPPAQGLEGTAPTASPPDGASTAAGPESVGGAGVLYVCMCVFVCDCLSTDRSAEQCGSSHFTSILHSSQHHSNHLFILTTPQVKEKQELPNPLPHLLPPLPLNQTPTRGVSLPCQVCTPCCM